MKAILAAAVVWATTVTEPAQECPSFNDLKNKNQFSFLEPFMTAKRSYFLLGKIGQQNVILSRNENGRYCHAVSVPDEVWNALKRRYQSFLI